MSPAPGGTAPRIVRLEAAGKVNLGWRVGERGDDGYHEVSGLVQTVSVTDRLRIEVRDDVGEPTAVLDEAPLALRVHGPASAPDLGGPDDLVVAAARRIAEEVPPRPTRIVLHKRIPVAAGLGGGSADAAAVLVGLGLVWGARLGASDLVRIGADVSSDVPAILHGGFVHVSGRGERVAPAGVVSETRFVLGVAEGRLGAGEVYAALDELRSAGRFERRPDLWANDLEPAAIACEPALARRLETMREAGAPVAFVAGSGPSVVGVVPDPGDAGRVAEATGGTFARTIVCEPLPWGVRGHLS